MNHGSWLSYAGLYLSSARFNMDHHHKMDELQPQPFGPHPPVKQFVLCFDGTGNKFAGDVTDTNLVKIYRVGTPNL